MILLAVAPIYGKTHQHLQTKRLMNLKVGIHHRGLEPYKIYANDDPMLILTFFRARSNLLPNDFIWEMLNQ